MKHKCNDPSLFSSVVAHVDFSPVFSRVEAGSGLTHFCLTQFSPVLWTAREVWHCIFLFLIREVLPCVLFLGRGRVFVCYFGLGEPDAFSFLAQLCLLRVFSFFSSFVKINLVNSAAAVWFLRALHTFPVLFCVSVLRGVTVVKFFLHGVPNVSE